MLIVVGIGFGLAIGMTLAGKYDTALAATNYVSRALSVLIALFVVGDFGLLQNWEFFRERSNRQRRGIRDYSRGTWVNWFLLNVLFPGVSLAHIVRVYYIYI